MSKPIKVYLAAPYAGREILKDHVADSDLWGSDDFEVTCGWVRGTRPLGADTYGVSEASTEEEVAAHAAMDLADIDAADVLVHYTAAYLQQLDPSLGSVTHNLHSGGRHVETGYALAREKPVIVIGLLENIFQRGLCRWEPTALHAANHVRLGAPPNTDQKED